MTGDEIWSPKLIAKNYATSVRLYLDIISAFPIEAFAMPPRVYDILTLLGMCKIARVLDIGQIIANLNVRMKLKAALKVLYLIFMLLLYMHVFSCFFWYLFSIARTWVPQTEFIYGENIVWE